MLTQILTIQTLKRAIPTSGGAQPSAPIVWRPMIAVNCFCQLETFALASKAAWKILWGAATEEDMDWEHCLLCKSYEQNVRLTCVRSIDADPAWRLLLPWPSTDIVVLTFCKKFPVQAESFHLFNRSQVVWLFWVIQYLGTEIALSLCEGDDMLV